MECHCNDHRPGQWHSHKDCDCAHHESPSYTFVVTKVMEEDPGQGTVYISKDFMEKLGVLDGDHVEIVDAGGYVVQARSHPNPWIDTRMISLDQHTLEKTGCRLFGQVKLRKTSCGESECVTLEVPPHVGISRLQLRSMMEESRGAVLSERGLCGAQEQSRRRNPVSDRVMRTG